MFTEMQKLARLLKLAKMSPMQQHAVSDAYRAHMTAPTAPPARPMVRDPHAFSQHQQMMQNPGQYVPQGQVSSGLELATPPRQYKRASELENLSTLMQKHAVGPRTVQRAIAQATEFGTHNYGRGKVQRTLERSEMRADAPAGSRQGMGANERARTILQSGGDAPRSAKDHAALARAQVHNAVRDELALTSGLRPPQEMVPKGSVLPRPTLPPVSIPSTMYQPPASNELRKLAACLKDNKSWMPEGRKKKDTTGMAGNEGSKTSELQKLSALLQKHAGRPPMGFMQQGVKQISGLVNNPGGMWEAAKKVHAGAGGGLAGAGAVAQKYAPGAAMIAAPVAAGALGMHMLSGRQQPEQMQQQQNVSFKTGAARIAELSKAAWSITDEGHKLDAAHYNADSEAAYKKIKPQEEYAKTHPTLASVATTGHLANLLAPFLGIPGANLLPISNASGLGAAMNKMEARHLDYAAKKHEKGENAYNPFGGYLTKSRHEEKDEAEAAKKAKDPEKKKDTEKKSSLGPQMQALRAKIAVAPLAAAIPAVAGAAKGLMAGAAGRYVASKAVPMAMNGAMNAMGAPPGQRLRAFGAGAATGLIPGSGMASQVAGMAAQPLANKAFGVG